MGQLGAPGASWAWSQPPPNSIKYSWGGTCSKGLPCSHPYSPCCCLIQLWLSAAQHCRVGIRGTPPHRPQPAVLAQVCGGCGLASAVGSVHSPTPPPHHCSAWLTWEGHAGLSAKQSTGRGEAEAATLWPALDPAP